MQQSALYRKLFGLNPQPDPFVGVRFVSPLVLPATKHRCRFRKCTGDVWDGRQVYVCRRCGSYYGWTGKGWKLIDRRPK